MQRGRRADDGGGHEVARRAAVSRILPVLPHLRAAYARTRRRAIRQGGNPYDGEVEYADEIVGRLLDHLREKNLYDSRHHRPALGPRRGARRSRRRGARDLPLPRDHPRAAHHQAAAERAAADAASRRRCSTSTWCRRSSISADRIAAAGASRRTRGPLAAPGPRRQRHARGGEHLLRVAVAALSLRLERALRAQRRSLPLDPRAEGRAVRPRAGPEGADVDRGGPAAGAQARCAARSTAMIARCRRHRAVGRLGRGPPEARGARLRRHAERRRAAAARRQAAGSEGQGRGPADVSRAPAASRARDSSPKRRAVPPAAEGRPGHDGRLAAARRGLQPAGAADEAVAAYKEVIDAQPEGPRGLTGAAAALLARRPDRRSQGARGARRRGRARRSRTRCSRGSRSTSATTTPRAATRSSRSRPTPPCRCRRSSKGCPARPRAVSAAAAERFARSAGARWRARTVQLADLNYYPADSLARLERYAEAEPLFNAELALFPAHVRARAGLAMLYRATGRDAESDAGHRRARSPQPVAGRATSVAAQLWTMFGEPERAAAADSGPASRRRRDRQVKSGMSASRIPRRRVVLVPPVLARRGCVLCCRFRRLRPDDDVQVGRRSRPLRRPRRRRSGTPDHRPRPDEIVIEEQRQDAAGDAVPAGHRAGRIVRRRGDARGHARRSRPTTPFRAAISTS